MPWRLAGAHGTGKPKRGRKTWSRPCPQLLLSLRSPGHTANAFAWAYVADHYGGAWMGAGAYATAGLIGIGRMERNAHHLSDVVGGAALGYLVSRTVVRKNGDLPSGATAASSSARASSREPPMVRVFVRF